MFIFPFLVFSPVGLTLPAQAGRLQKGKKVPGEKLPALIPNSDLLVAPSFEKISPTWQEQLLGRESGLTGFKSQAPNPK